MRLIHVVVSAIIAASAGLIIWVAVSSHQWNQRCEDAGGVVVSEYVGDITTFAYTYDAKGNVTSMIPVTTPQYNYYCVVNGQYVEV